MPYPEATDDDVAFFEEHGWIVVEDAVDPADLGELESRCEELIERRNTHAYDWAWEKGKDRDERDFKILQASPTRFWPELKASSYHRWAVTFASTLMRRPVEFWYDQFLAKPPGYGAPTLWHQDEGYWGRNLDDLGITCWMPFHDVDPSNGCMHFIDGGHHDGVIEHRLVENVQSDLLHCEPDESRTVACPLRHGAVTFHHSKTPHMTPGNSTSSWRRILTAHMRVVGSGGEGDHYPWKIYVNQLTGERSTPTTR